MNRILNLRLAAAIVVSILCPEQASHDTAQ
jgi:hypothetical protein